jgi:hypothetical protein
VPRTPAEKILLDRTDADEVTPGEIVKIRCGPLNDVSGPIFFRRMAEVAAKIHHYDRPKPSPSGSA